MEYCIKFSKIDSISSLFFNKTGSSYDIIVQKVHNICKLLHFISNLESLHIFLCAGISATINSNPEIPCYYFCVGFLSEKRYLRYCEPSQKPPFFPLPCINETF
jgi:hypothetical protein